VAAREERYTVTLDQLVQFAQEGWHYPLKDDSDTKKQIKDWLSEHSILEGHMMTSNERAFAEALGEDQEG